MKILLDGKELILQNQILDINSANPFLENDEERIDNIFSIQVPITGNEKALNYADNIDSIINNSFTCEIISDVNFYGTAIITEASHQSNIATIQIGFAKSHFSYLIKDKKMKELDLGNIICRKNLKTTCSLTNITHAGGRTNLVQKTFMSFVSGDSSYFQNQGIYYNKKETINYKIRIRASITNCRNFRLTIGKDNNTIDFFLQEGEVNSSYTIDKNVDFFLNGDVFDNMFIWLIAEPFVNNPGITIHYLIYDVEAIIYSDEIEVNNKVYPEVNYCFPIVKNNNMYDFLPNLANLARYKEYPLINDIFANDITTKRNVVGGIISKFIAPFVFVGYLIDKIFQTYGYRLINNPFKNDFNNLVVFNGYAVGDYTINNNNFQLSIPDQYALSNAFDNDSTISQFLDDLAIVTGFFRMFDHQSKTVEFVPLTKLMQDIIHIDCEVIDDTIEYDYDNKGIEIEIKPGNDSFIKNNSIKEYNYKGNITHYAWLLTIIDVEVNDCYLVVNERKYYAFIFKGNSYGWTFVAYDYSLNEQEGEENYVKFSSETPIMVGIPNTIYPSNTPINMPSTSQPIKINKCYDSYNHKFSNSFMFVHGLKTAANIGEYLYASADNYYGSSLSGTKSLRVDKEYGLMQNAYKHLVRLYTQGKKHTLTCIMDKANINKLTYRSFIEINNSVNILLSYNYSSTESEYVQVELELIKI